MSKNASSKFETTVGQTNESKLFLSITLCDSINLKIQ